MRFKIGDRRYGGGYLTSLISYLLSPICVPPEGPAARQALVGNAWHAPLPLLLQVPFIAHVLALLSVFFLLAWSCKRRLRDWVFLSFSLAGLLLCGLPYIGWVALMLLVLPLLILADRRSRPRLGGLMFLCLSPVLYAAGCWVLLSYLILDDPLFAWRFIPRLALAPLPREALWTAAVAAGVAAAAAAAEIIDNRYEIIDNRYGAPQPSSVICSDSRQRSLRAHQGVHQSAHQGAFHLLSIIYYPLSIICAATAAAALWFGALSAAGLDWALPWGRPANLPPPDRDAVARHVKEATPWGRVFVCGYAGLGGGCTNAADAALFETCLDPHIGMLRRAYVRQRLYLLVPRPDKENALDPCEWRYDGLYAGGAQRLLFDRDFGAWRLYAVISADGVGGDDGR